MTLVARRGFLTGLGSLVIAAPAVVNYASLMPVRGIIMPPEPSIVRAFGLDRGYYNLVGRNVVPAENLIEWAKRFEAQQRHIAISDTKIKGKKGNVRVSTVFLGIDHSFDWYFEDKDRVSKPVVFETMVFGGKLDQEQDRYSTYDEAERGHKEMLAKVRRSEMKIIKLDET